MRLINSSGGIHFAANPQAAGGIGAKSCQAILYGLSRSL
jgi:hypothetical protein